MISFFFKITRNIRGRYLTGNLPGTHVSTNDPKNCTKSSNPLLSSKRLKCLVFVQMFFVHLHLLGIQTIFGFSLFNAAVFSVQHLAAGLLIAMKSRRCSI